MSNGVVGELLLEQIPGDVGAAGGEAGLKDQGHADAHHDAAVHAAQQPVPAVHGTDGGDQKVQDHAHQHRGDRRADREPVAEVKPGQHQQGQIDQQGQRTDGQAGQVIDHQGDTYGSAGGDLRRDDKILGSNAVHKCARQQQQHIFDRFLFHGSSPNRCNPPASLTRQALF